MDNKKLLRGQLAFEFMLIYSFFILVFVATLFIVTQNSEQQQTYAQGIFARQVAIGFSDEIATASYIPGYTKNYSFPQTLESMPYSITVYNGILDLNYTYGTNIDVLYPLATNNVILNGINTSIRMGSFNTTDEWASISNVNGSVVISQ